MPLGDVCGAGAGGGGSEPWPCCHLVDDAVLVGFDRGVTASAAGKIVGSSGAVELAAIGGTHILRVPSGRVLSTVAALETRAGIRYAEPDYLQTLNAEPNDPSFGSQWGLESIGQPVNGVTSKPGADIAAPAAWDVTTGSASIVIGELDSGVDYTHPDLAANVWTNPGGVGGCAAGTHGYKVLTHMCDPMDDYGHGTHVAGILGAVGNNGIGVSGLNQSTTILPVKWTDSTGIGTTSFLIAAMDWALQANAAGVNVKVVNDSATFIGTAFSQALLDEINALGSAGILFVTAAGNSNKNNDVTTRYPCNYGTSNEICVAASDQNDKKAGFSNWGPNSVDLAAPGKSIYSTLRGETYGFMDGTSMATPMVAGAAALVLSQQSLSVEDLKADILGNVDPLPGLLGKVRTGGRLNVCRALIGCVNELVGNPGFEAATVGWAPSGSHVTLARVSGGHTGAWNALLSNTGSSKVTCAVTDSPNSITTTSAGTYHGSVWLEPGVAGMFVQLRLREMQGSTTIGEAIAGANLDETDEWQQLSVDYTAQQPGSTTLDFRVYATRAQPGVCFDLDDASLLLSPRPLPEPGHWQTGAAPGLPRCVRRMLRAGFG